ncbi:MAG: hypothetical protein V4490_03915 [Pseudomonadota bacterium]
MQSRNNSGGNSEVPQGFQGAANKKGRAPALFDTPRGYEVRLVEIEVTIQPKGTDRIDIVPVPEEGVFLLVPEDVFPEVNNGATRGRTRSYHMSEDVKKEPYAIVFDNLGNYLRLAHSFSVYDYCVQKGRPDLFKPPARFAESKICMQSLQLLGYVQIPYELPLNSFEKFSALMHAETLSGELKDTMAGVPKLIEFQGLGLTVGDTPTASTSEPAPNKKNDASVIAIKKRYLVDNKNEV